MIDRQLKLNLHVKDLQTRRLDTARHISSKCGAIHQVIRTFYTAAIRSTIEYGAPILITASQTVLKKVEILQNKAMHTIAQAPIWTNKSTLHAELNLPPLQVR